MASGDDRYAGDFFKLIMAGEWGGVHTNCREYPNNIALPLTKTGDNVIHLAVSRGETDWLENLLRIPMQKTIILKQNTEGDTPLNLAAMRGDRRMCELLCRRGTAALTTRNNRGEAPMYLASVMGEMGAFNFLLGKFMELYSVPVPLVSWDQMSSIQRKRCNEACIKNDKDTILHAAIRGEFIDLAYKIFQQFQYLAIVKNNEGETPIHLLAKLPSSFRSGYRPGIFKRLVYYCIPENLAWKERLERLVVSEDETRIQTNMPALNERSESSQTENEARIQTNVPALSEISESSPTEYEARIQTNVPALSEISETFQIENVARIQINVPALSDISESSQTENEARIQTNVPVLSEISESSQTENETRIQNDAPALNIEISESSQTENETRIQNDAMALNLEILDSPETENETNNQSISLLTRFRDQATSMSKSWFRRAQYWVVGFFCPKSVIKEKRKHILSYAIVERTIEYLKQQPEIDQSNPWTRSESAATNPSEETVANSSTSEEGGTSNASEETVANSDTSEEEDDASSSSSEETVANSDISAEAGTSNPSTEETDVSSNTSEETVTNNTLENTNIIDAPIVSAVKMGITEMVSMIVESFPFTVEEVDRNGKNLVFVAAESRQPQVLQLLLKLNIRQTLVTGKLEDGKNVLHVAAELQKDHHPWSIISGAPLQMHLETKWFELVKDLMPSHLQLYKNSNGEKPNEVFEKSHEKLVGEGLEWLSSTARSCTVISSLLTTAALATAATVPGGVDQHGVPNLRDNWRFKVFIISALMTVCSGVLSLVLFLVILSSRSDVKNFKVGLPRKLIYGLATLCFSLSTLLLAFCSAQSFAIHGRVRYAAYVLYTILASSIIYLVKEHLPLFFDFIEITSAKLQDWSNS